MSRQRGERAKGANRSNPRIDRNVGTPSGYEKRTRGSGQVLELVQPQKPKKSRVEIVPRNINQETFLTAINNPSTHVVFGVGPAGTGKTLIATMAAVKALKMGLVEKIVITRPNVAVDDKDIGYLPGDILKKMTPWMMPVLDVFADYYTQAEITAMLEENIIEMVPIAFIRGRTFKNAFIIVDEAQGTTANSMLSILTRIGENSKMVVTGDLAQSDRGEENGLRDFLNRFTNSKSIEVIKFGRQDVERHVVVKELLGMYPDKDV